jgi:hypothetical protein
VLLEATFWNFCITFSFIEISVFSFYSSFFLCFRFLLSFPLFWGFLLPFIPLPPSPNIFFVSIFLFVWILSLTYLNLLGNKKLGCCMASEWSDHWLKPDVHK